jgi:hypothetical protein
MSRLLPDLLYDPPTAIVASLVVGGTLAVTLLLLATMSLGSPSRSSG